MASFQFDLVTAERLVFSGAVDQVDVPGAEGGFGVLPGHAPFVSTLKSGILVIHEAGAQQRIIVRGGFAEVGPSGLTVLADHAVAFDDVDRAQLASDIAALRDDLAASLLTMQTALGG